MDLWFSEVHTPDVKLSLRTAKQLYAGKSGMAGYRSLGYTSFWENTDFKMGMSCFQMRMILSTMK